MRLLRRAWVVFQERGPIEFLATVWWYLRDQIFISFIIKPAFRFIRNALALVVPKKPGLVVCGFTERPSGNSGDIYERLKQTDQLRPTWITDSKQVYEEMSAQDEPVAYEHSLRGQKCLLEADVACYDTLNREPVPDRVTRIKIYHQVPVKRGPRAALRAVVPTDASLHDYIVTTSDFLGDHQYEYHSARKGGDRVRREQFINLGFPRNDALVNPTKRQEEIWSEFIDGEDYDMVILYAPTCRQEDLYSIDNTDIFPFKDFSLSALEQLLEELNALLLLRPHPSDVRKIQDRNQQYNTMHDYGALSRFFDDLCSLDRVRRGYDEQLKDTTNILPFTDVLVTDYSTIYHSFLLLDRPILLFPYDYETFEEQHGFKYDYLSNLPGPAIQGFSEFSDYLSDLAEGNDPHQQERHALRKKIYDYPDGNSTERVIDFMWECSSISRADRKSERDT